MKLTTRTVGDVGATRSAPSGATLECLACGGRVRSWRPAGGRRRPRAKCPHCGAFERHRFLGYLFKLLSARILSARTVLDIAPHPQIRQLLRRDHAGRYVGLDLGRHRLIDVQGDLTTLCFPDSTFDLCVCYHVFEHIPDDRAAMSELARVMRPDGLAFIQVPWRSTGATEEDPAAPEAERIERFGQSDHVRIYGSDFDDRLRAAGFRVHRAQPCEVLPPEDLYRHALNSHETVWICHTGDSLHAEMASWLQQVRRSGPQGPRPRSTLKQLGADLDRCRRVLATARAEVKDALASADLAHREARQARAEADAARRKAKRALRENNLLRQRLTETKSG